MKLLYRVISLGLVLVLLAACSPPPQTIEQQLLEQTAPFDNTNLPEGLADLMMREQVNLLGEQHWISQTHDMLDSLIPQLHARGLRVSLLELPLFVGPILDLYVTGRIEAPFNDEVIEEFFQQAHVIEACAAWNKQLRERGEADQQVRLYAFDQEIALSKTYVSLVRLLRREAGLGKDYFFSARENLKLLESDQASGLDGALEDDFRWLSQHKLVVDQDRSVFQPENNDIFSWLRLNPDVRERRERLMAENVAYFLSKHPDDKFLVITGAAHAQRQGDMAVDMIDFKPLARRLVESGRAINSLMMAHRDITFIEFGNLPIKHTIKMKLNDSDLFRLYSEQFGDSWLYSDLRPLRDQAVSVSLSYLENDANFNLAREFDGLIVIPEVELMRPYGND